MAAFFLWCPCALEPLDRRPNRTPNWTGTCAIDARIASPIKAPGGHTRGRHSTAVSPPVTSMPRSGYQPPPAHSSRARGRQTARQHSTPAGPLAAGRVLVAPLPYFDARCVSLGANRFVKASRGPAGTRRPPVRGQPPAPLPHAELRCPAPDGPTADRVSFVLLYFWSVLFMPVQVHCRDSIVPVERVRVTIGMIFLILLRSATLDTRRSRSFSHSFADKSPVDGCEVTHRALRSSSLKSARLGPSLGLPSVGTRATKKPMSLSSRLGPTYILPSR